MAATLEKVMAELVSGHTTNRLSQEVVLERLWPLIQGPAVHGRPGQELG
jgi:hypothetical protein